MKNKKKLQRITALFILVLIFAMGIETANSYAASQKRKALKAYRHLLEQEKINFEEEEDIEEGSWDKLENMQFAIAYIDKDKVPELIIYSGEGNEHGIYGAGILYTYKKNRLRRVGNLGISIAKRVRYYKRKGYIMDVVYDDMEHDWIEFTKLSGTKLKYCSTGTEYDYDHNKWRYTYKGKYCSKSSYKTKIRKMTRRKSASKFKWRKNTYENRKKYLK